MTLCLESKTRDIFGVWEVSVLINSKSYTYPINSEFVVRKVEDLIRKRRFGKALKLLNLFKVSGFNSFEKGENCNG